MQGYIFWPFPPPLPLRGWEILSKLVNREEFEGLKKVPKNSEEFRQGGGQFFWLARIHASVLNVNKVINYISYSG